MSHDLRSLSSWTRTHRDLHSKQIERDEHSAISAADARVAPTLNGDRVQQGVSVDNRALHAGPDSTLEALDVSAQASIVDTVLSSGAALTFRVADREHDCAASVSLLDEPGRTGSSTSVERQFVYLFVLVMLLPATMSSSSVLCIPLLH